MIKILNLKIVITSEFLNTKIFLLNDTSQIGLKKFLLLVKLKIHFHGQNTNQKEFRTEKLIKRKGDNLFNSWTDKKDFV